MLFCFGFSAFGFETITHPSRYLTSIVDKTRHGPVIAPFSAQLLQLFQLCWRCLLVRGDAYMTSTLRGWGEGKNEMLSDVRVCVCVSVWWWWGGGGGGRERLDFQFLFSLLMKLGFAPEHTSCWVKH